MPKPTLILIAILTAATTQAANWPDHPQLRAVRATAPIKLDGDLNDEAWQTAPEFTDFTQHDPDDKQPSTLPTSIRIIYDDEAIYFGAKMTDPEHPTALLARRDNFTQSDFLAINIDPQLDRLSGNCFVVFPANTQVDTVLYNDIGEDASWDGVWQSAARVVSDGWIAEVRVPYSQLRFPDKDIHVWGLNITRRTIRKNETVRIVNTPKGETGFVSHFADITGIEGIRRGRPLEIVPYAIARSDYRTRFDGPVDRSDSRADGGLDLKYALTPTITLTGTLNPDFGQVEVDPAVVNLGQFETFYPEKRPFFTEGVSIFRFGDTPAPAHFNFLNAPQTFYSRRIGRDVDSSDARIYAATKLTGKLPGGWTLGVLDALTDAADGTNYFVSRGTKELGDGARLGYMATSVNRSELRSAQTGGVDGYASFFGKSWIVEGSLTGSRLSGDADEIAAAQMSPARYYARPDASHIEFDPLRTSLTGWGGRAMVSKTTGLWRPIVQVHAYSPGFETNDLGFMTRTDMISPSAVMMYVNQNPGKRTRERNVWFGAWQNANFDGDTLERGVFADWFVTTTNYLRPRAAIFLTAGGFDDRLTRGGPVVRTPRYWSSDLSFGTDERKKFVFEVESHLERGGDGSYMRQFAIGLTARPASNLQLEIEPGFAHGHTVTQYVARADGRYIFAELEQREFEIATRADWTLTSKLSFQLYMQPFIASGDYHDYHALVAPRTREYEPVAYSASPNFNFRSVRGSAVVRWEFRPGSALYVAWNENRAGEVGVGDFNLSRDLRAIPSSPSHDVFMVKVSYWLPM
ncbi:MAG: carbohydrate binding family 9 domain-containing protein [Thermoanaerobaculia bacterium]|nr:carbohydrate binding family 9 domain-containing protein [Thermoanaerobaculia bacterium]